MTATERAARTAAADRLCVDAYDVSSGPRSGVALVAVGGYGRGELAPHSDLDLVLVHDDAVDATALGQRIWYPLWDADVRLDHSVRSVSGALAAAGEDTRVALGLQDARFVAGDPALVLRLRTVLLAQWRREARRRLPELRDLVARRHALMGELAHASVPDLKEAMGGLRDVGVVRAAVATWLVDAPLVELEQCRQVLLDVRDIVQDWHGRANDRVTPELWAELAADPSEAQAMVRRTARRIAHVSGLTWRRVDDVLRRPRTVGARRPHLDPIGPGVAVAGGEVVLGRGAWPQSDPLLLLRVCAEAAQRDLVLAPSTAARVARECPPLPTPWPPAARQLLVRLLAAGPGLLPVWETLDQVDGVRRVLPEWERVRGLPHASVVHRFTVERHLVETCVEAGALIRRVARPDVLLVAALLHDIGKGGPGDHSRVGEPMARTVAVRMGFTPQDVDLVGTLVRWHLLLATTATTRDPEDPATVAAITSRIRSREALDLLATLTEADARATSTKAWSRWRAGLVHQLAQRCHAALAADGGGLPTVARRPGPTVQVPAALLSDPGAVDVQVEGTGDGARVTVVSGDRVGLLADAAAMLVRQRTSIRAARAWTQGNHGISVWEVADQHLDPPVLRQSFTAFAAGRIPAAARTPGVRPDRLAPSVVVRPEASASATVLEVRTEDRPGVVHLICSALADLEISVRSAHLDTLGPQAIDVFYLQEIGAGALSDVRASSAAHAVRERLGGERG